MGERKVSSATQPLGEVEVEVTPTDIWVREDDVGVGALEGGCTYYGGFGR